MEHHLIFRERLTIARVREILERRLPLALSDDARQRIIRCREYLDRKMEHPERPIYGITTGFGSLCDISVGRDELSRLQRNLVMSHACGTGERVPSEIVRLILLLKIQSLSYGYSGVQLRPSSGSSSSSTATSCRSSTSRDRSAHRATWRRWPT